MLMVGALNCKNYFLGVAATYNGFMRAKKEFILANLYVVRAHFVREAGTAEGATSFASYETLAGNKYSTTLYERAKCETIDAYTRIAAGASDADLIKLVGLLSPGPLPSGCKVAARQVAATPAPVATPALAVFAPEPTADRPITEAERIAASTHRLLTARALARSAAASPAVTVLPVATAPDPAAAIAAPPTEEETVVPAALLIADAKPAPEPIKAVVVAEPAKLAAARPAAAPALAEAAKALAAAAAAMQQPGVN